LLGWGIPAERITIVGNLVIDGALGEAAGKFGGDAESGAARDGVIFFPGSRKHEIEQMFPLFVRTAVQLRRRLPASASRLRARRSRPMRSSARARAGRYRPAYGIPSVLAADGASLEAAASGLRW